MESENLKYKVDRSGWPKGPWDGEVEDRVDFEHVGFACLLLRNNLGNWCGYVGVGPDHPMANSDYGDMDVEVQIHGGLTYSGKCRPPICHVPKPGMPEDVTWFGFDCAHCGDVVPGMRGFSQGQYRTLAYVKRETESLAEQLKAIQEK